MLLEAHTEKEINAKIEAEASHETRTVSTFSSRLCMLVQAVAEGFLHSPVDTLKLGVPTLLYSCQNGLVYFAIDLLPVSLFQITQQTKIITTAALSSVILKRSYVSAQWVAIIAFSIGAALCTLATLSQPHKSENEQENIIEGISILLVSKLCIFTCNSERQAACGAFASQAGQAGHRPTARVWPVCAQGHWIC